MKRAFIIAAFGNRGIQVQRLIKNIRSYVDYPIHIITTRDSNIGTLSVLHGTTLYFENDHNTYIEFVERIWPVGSYREGIRNTNYWKIQRVLYYGSEYDSVCLLDDDMFIVHEAFTDGFDIAENFGVALPLNPRVYIKYNAMGADVSDKDLDDIFSTPAYSPACNFSPFFVSARHWQTNTFLRYLKNQLRYHTCRGTLAIWKSSWETKYSPVYLPEQWCVCGDNAEHIKNCTMLLKGQQVKIPVMMLHLGHDKVKKVFKDAVI